MGIQPETGGQGSCKRNPSALTNVKFVDDKTFKIFQNLKTGKYEEKQLYESILKAIAEIRINSSCGIKIQRNLWPEYYNKHEIDNLWKYNLPNGWRLIYTISAKEVVLIAIILEWFNHKDYEKRFNYN